MADYARSLISKIIEENDIVPAMASGIRAGWFEDDEHQRVFEWMLAYYTRYGSSPTERAFKRQFPAYRLLRVEEPYAYYVDHFREQRRRLIIVDSMIDADTALKSGDHDAAQAAISKGLMRVGTEISSLTDDDATDNLRGRFDTYKAKTANAGKLIGIPTGFPTLDMVSGGWQAQQFILFGGSAKQNKSFMLMKSAMAAQDAGRRVLFMSFEMSVDEQMCRYDAMASGINALHLLQGNMTVDEMRRLKKGLGSRRHLPSFVISADISASTTVSGLAAKIEQHQPDVVFVDGCYLMDNEIGAPPLSVQAFTAISRGLKRLAQRIDKPLVGTTQALPGKMKDGKVTLYSLGWTSAWAQDADVILGVERTKGTSMSKLRVVAGRNVSPRVISVLCDYDESIFEEVDSTEEEEDD